LLSPYPPTNLGVEMLEKQVKNLQKRREELKKEIDKINDFEQMEQLVTDYITLNQMLYELGKDHAGKEAYNDWKLKR